MPTPSKYTDRSKTPIDFGMGDKYVYVYAENEVPFYVGQGTGKRIQEHTSRPEEYNRKDPFHNKLRKMIREGHRFSRYKIAIGLSHALANYIEINLIQAWGRLKDGGTLYNLQLGGQYSRGRMEVKYDAFGSSMTLKMWAMESGWSRQILSGHRHNLEQFLRGLVAKRYLSTDGRSLTKAQWLREPDSVIQNMSTLNHRLKKGMSILDAIRMPPLNNNAKKSA